MNTQRILLGLAAAVVSELVAGQLLSLTNLSAGPVVQTVALTFLGAAVGAFVARRGFVLPALGLWLVEWLVVVYLLYRVAQPSGQASIRAIVQLNLLSIVLCALAVVGGVWLGQAVARRSQDAVPEG